MLTFDFNFEEFDIKSLTENLPQLLNENWMLITAGTINKFNTMTASWGAFGTLWHKTIVFIFVRPHRYTFEFIENNSLFTLSFFSENYKDVLNFCGQHSGRQVDKIKETGLEPVVLPSNGIGFFQANLIIECKKLYADDIKNDRFLEKEIINKTYPQKDFHRFYIAEMQKAYIKK